MINIKFKFPDWKAKLEQAEAEINLFLAANIQFNRGMLFDKEGAYNGRPRWQDLKFRRGQILSKRGTLRKSIAPYNPRGVPGPDGIVRFSGDVITVGTKLMKARLMNDGTSKLPGGVLRPVRAKALMIPLPEGQWANESTKRMRKKAKTVQVKQESGKMKNQKVIFRKYVRIPARPFDTWNRQDQNEIDAALKNKIIQVLNRGK